jgi:hypothetical protein
VVTPSEIVDQLEQDLMTIAINMTHEIPLTETKRRVFLTQVKKYVRHLSAAYCDPSECLCRKWIIKRKGRYAQQAVEYGRILRGVK